LDSATGVGTGTGGRVNTAAGNLAARTTASGGVFVNELDTVTLATIGTVANRASGGGAFDVVSGGNMIVNSMTTSGSFTAKAPLINGHDTTTFGNQLWDGTVVTFNSTETTNGGTFTVTGSTQLGDNVTINASNGAVAFQGTVVGTTAGGQFLVVNSTGQTSFGSTVGTALIPISKLTTDAGGGTSFNGNVFTGGPGVTSGTTTILLGDSATGTGTLTSTGGLISLSDISTTLQIDTAGSIVFTGINQVGAPGSALVFVQTPLNVQTLNAISLTFASPVQPTGLIFATGSSVTGVISGVSVALASNASQLLANATVSSVQGSAATAVAEASKVGFDTDSVAQQINYGFVGDIGVSPPMNHTIGETGVSVPAGFGEEEEEEDEEEKKKLKK
jgi:hypothetical protein